MKFIKRKSALKPITGSIVDTFNINDKTTNAPSLRLMIDLLYPVGRGFIDFTDTDYSNWLGLTWERELLGVTPIGYKEGDADFGTIGNTGGEKTVTLNVNQIPSHTHDIVYTDSNSPTQSMQKNSINVLSWGNQWRGVGDVILSNGGGQAHNNLPPYQVVSYWKRVDPNAVKLISFTIDGTSYQAEDGMTWYDWCNSDYNTSVWVCSSPTETTIYFGDSQEDYLALEAGYKPTKCTASDVIIANYAYGTGTSSK